MGFSLKISRAWCLISPLLGVSQVDPDIKAVVQAMRKEFDDMALSGSDIPAPELQGSPAASVPVDKVLPALDGTLTGTSLDLSWPDAVGSTYDIMQKTNLLDAAWTTNQSGVVGSPITVPANEKQSFYRIEVGN